MENDYLEGPPIQVVSEKSSDRHPRLDLGSMQVLNKKPIAWWHPNDG